jgi:hypothetical protein
MTNNFEEVNRILEEWNPIGVTQDIAKDEYKAYIPLILNSIGDRKQLMSCLEDILINKLEIGYDPTNKKHLNDLEQVCDTLMAIRQSL